MKYKAQPNSGTLVIWIILFFLLAGLVYWLDQPDDWWWPLSGGGFLVPILFLSWMHFVSYKVESQKLKITPFTYWQSSIDLNNLISIKKKKSNRFQRIFGMPSTSLELYIERHGHLELWTDDESLFEKLKDFEKAEKSTLVNG